MTNICVIPARGGSQRIPKKNIKLFHGKPIIHYSIDAARASGLFDQVIVSTDSDEVVKALDRYVMLIAIRRRPSELAANSVGTLAVTGDVARLYKGDYICCVYATSPMLRPADLIRGFENLTSKPEACHCVSVGTQPLRDAAQFYWSTAEHARCEDPYYVFQTLVEPIDENRICDINTPEDWARAERMYEELHK